MGAAFFVHHRNTPDEELKIQLAQGEPPRPGRRPALIAIGAAATSSAQTTPAAPTTTVGHPAFPHQTNIPEAGTSVHHHHQNHR